MSFARSSAKATFKMNDSNRDEAFRRQRVVRIFVSSTFKDMHAERDELVYRVFPALRNRCEERGVTWSEVDLRWGITEEEMEQGRVLPICLAEIDNCRPFFLCLLGDRYGWVPDAIPHAMIREYPWLVGFRGASVTELEIQHAVFQYQNRPIRPFFYLRDRAVNVEGRDRVVEPEAFLERLKRLRELIIQNKSTYSVREDYRSAKELGQLIRADLEAEIDRLFPPGKESNPIQRLAWEHANFARANSLVHIGRADHFAALDAHLGADGPPLAVTGETGAGKTSLLASWVQSRFGDRTGTVHLSRTRWRRLQERLYSLVGKEEVFAAPVNHSIFHFIGATPESTNWSEMLQRIIASLNLRFGLDIEPCAEPFKLMTQFSRCLQAASLRGKCVILLDGLDHLENVEQALDLPWLPIRLPPEVRLIVSTGSGRSLQEIRRRGWPLLKLEPLGRRERTRFLETYLQVKYSKRFSAGLKKRIAASPQTALPSYLSTLCDEVRLFGDHENLGERVEHYLAAETIQELYDKVLERIEQVYETDRSGLVRETMCYLFASRDGLSEPELLDLLGTNSARLPGVIWSPLYLAVRQILVPRPGTLALQQEPFRRAVENRYLLDPGLAMAVHERLARYFEGRPDFERKYDELPWHWTCQGAWEELVRLLVDPDWLSKASGRRSYEIKEYWAQIERHSSFRMVEAYGALVDAVDAHPGAGWAIFSLFTDAGHTAEAFRLGKRLAELASRRRDFLRLQAILGTLAMLSMRSGDWEAAMQLFSRQEAVCEEHDLQAGLAASLTGQGAIFYRRTDLATSLNMHHRAESIFRQIGDPVGVAAALGNQALIHLDRNELGLAENLFKEQEAICRRTGDLPGLQKCLGNFGVLCFRRGKLKEADRLHAEETEICRRLNDTYALQSCLGNRALVRRALGDYDEAMHLLDEREAICRATNNPHALAHTFLQQALLFGESLGQLEDGIELALAAAKTAPSESLELHTEAARLISKLRS